MSKKLNDKQLKKDIRSIVERYLQAVIESGVPVKEAYVFGSRSKGNSRAESDIDVCVVSPSFRRQWWNTQLELRSIRRKIDLRLEPHGFAPEDFIPEHPLVPEIKMYGVRMR